jgi:hypothetical protein
MFIIKMQKYAILIHIPFFIAAVVASLVFNQGSLRYDGPIGFLMLYVIVINALFGTAHGVIAATLCTFLSFMSRLTQNMSFLNVIGNGAFLAHFAILIITTVIVGILHDKYIALVFERDGLRCKSAVDAMAKNPTEAAQFLDDLVSVTEVDITPPVQKATKTVTVVPLQSSAVLPMQSHLANAAPFAPRPVAAADVPSGVLYAPFTPPSIIVEPAVTPSPVQAADLALSDGLCVPLQRVLPVQHVPVYRPKRPPSPPKAPAARNRYVTLRQPRPETQP